MLFKPKWVKLLWRNLRPDIKRINELEKLRVASNIAHETLAVCILGSPVTTRRAVKVSLEHFSAHNPKATEKELFRMVYVSKLQALDLEVPEKEIDRSVESIESLDALRDSIVELEKLYLSFPVPLHIKKQIDKILAQEESDKKAPAENIIKSLEQTYFDLKKDNPDRDEHWLLANTWLNSYGSTKQAKQKGIEWAKFVAYKDTLQFSILEPPKSIRALALFLVYKELGEAAATCYSSEFSELMREIIESQERDVFLDKYKERNPRTWRENQAEDNSRYSLYWFFKGLEFQQEHPEEAEEAWSNSESKRKIE